jgi:hypothetical protein
MLPSFHKVLLIYVAHYNMQSTFGDPDDPDLGPRFGTPIWDPDLGPRFGTPIWDPDLGPQFGTPI